MSNDMTATPTLGEPSVEQDINEQARAQTGRREVRLRIDERELTTGYANAFRSNGTTEEVMIDFGMNLAVPAQGGQASNGTGEVLFKANHRVVMNFYSAKRLAMTLGQLVRRHEQQFGELKLNVADRVRR
jgi:hypothetical protein